MPANILRVGLVVPTAQIPRIEALESQQPGYSDIFPGTPGDLDGELGDYRSPMDPAPDSPMAELAKRIKNTRREMLRETDGENNLTPEARRILAAAEIQRKIVRSVAQVHSNLVDKGYAQDLTAVVLEHHLDEREQDRHEFYEGQMKDHGDALSELEAGAEESGPIDPLSFDALEQEVAKTNIGRSIELNRNRISRLHFEWLSSTVIIRELREQTADMDLPIAA